MPIPSVAEKMHKARIGKTFLIMGVLIIIEITRLEWKSILSHSNCSATPGFPKGENENAGPGNWNKEMDL